MTDKEIITALECCLDVSPSTCKNCPLFNITNSTMVCSKIATKFALDLINRQQAEIERLQNESIGNCELAISMRNDNNLKGDCSYCIDKAKAEAEQKLKEMRGADNG